MSMDNSFDLSDLNPDDLKALMAQISGMAGDDTGAAMDTDDGWKEKICQAVEFLISEVESLGSRVDNLQKLVVTDLFGAIQDQHATNIRTQSISGLQSKYGDLMAPHMPAIAALSPDTDIFSELHDLIENAKGQNPDMSDDDMDGLVKTSVQGLADKLAAVRGAKPAEDETPEEPDATATVVATKMNPAKAKVSEMVRNSALKMIR